MQSPSEGSPGLAKIQEHFTESVRAVFSKMVGCDVSPGEPSDHQCFEPQKDVQSSIRISGGLEALVVVSLDKEVAFAAAEAFLGEKPDSINADVCDLVGEIANMIGGRAKERLNVPNSRLGLPSQGCQSPSSFAEFTHHESAQLPFATPWGELTVEVATPKG